MNNSPIGIFDSGLGGLTVAKELAELMPHESLIYVGDQARCPYGSRDCAEVQNFVLQICNFLQKQGCKLIVIACNTATSCALEVAQKHCDVPVLGVINAGARAAINATETAKLALIGTQRTIESAAYPKAIHALDASVEIYEAVTPELTTIVEACTNDEMAVCVQKRGEYYHLVEGYLRPLLKRQPDTLLLGCTHYPVLTEALRSVAGQELKIVCAAGEVSVEARSLLGQREQLADSSSKPQSIFYTTGDNTEDFARKGSRIFGSGLDRVKYLSLDD